MELLAAFSVDWTDPITWSVIVAAIAALLVVLTFPAAKLGAQQVHVPIWVPVSIALIAFLGAGAGAWVYITKPIELQRSDAEYGREAMVVHGGGEGGEEQMGQMGMGMGMGMPSPGGGAVGYPGMEQRPEGASGPHSGGPFARFRLIGSLRTIQRLVASGELELTAEQSTKLVNLLQPIAEAEQVSDEQIEQLTQQLSQILTEEQRNALRQAARQRRGNRKARKGGRRRAPSIQEVAKEVIQTVQPKDTSATEGQSQDKSAPDTAAEQDGSPEQTTKPQE